MKMNFDAAGIITAFNEALEEEMTFLIQEGGRPLMAVDGVLIHQSEAGFLYSFDLEIESFLLDGTPVRVQQGPNVTRGEVVTVRGPELTLALCDDLGDYVDRADIFAEPWFLLAALQERLREVPERNLKMSMAVLEEAPARPFRFFPPSAAAGAQEEAVRLAGGREITFIWGPPGTGKTETLARITRSFHEQGGRVLILSHSNVAVDGAVMRAAAHVGEPASPGLVVRSGWARLPELRQSGLMASSLAAGRRPDLDEMRKHLEARRTALLADLRAGRRSDGRLGEVEHTLREVRGMLKDVEAEISREARVLGCTLAMAATDPVIYQGHFDAVLLDEASMAYIPQIFFAASLARKNMVISGDFRQLAPVALAQSNGVKHWLKRDIFDQTGIIAAFEAGQAPDIAVLRYQRRMHPAIAGFANDTVYGGLLYNAPETAGRAAPAATPPCPGPLTLVDLSDPPALCFRHGHSHFNPFSAFLALTLARQIRINGLTVGLITPYAAQAKLLNALVTGLLGSSGARSEAAGMVAATIHRFQGAEQDAIVLDLVDAFPQRGPGGILSRREGHAALRLLNVAVTRARSKLFVLAHRTFLESRLPGDSAVLQLFRYIQQNGRVISGSELLASLPDHIQGGALDMHWYTESRPVLEAWKDDVIHAAAVQMDWPAAAGPPAGMVKETMQRALTGGARIALRAGRPQVFPMDLQPFTVRHSPARIPITAVERRIFWYGCPWPGDGRVDHLSIRVCGEKISRLLMYLLEMDLRREFSGERYAGLKAYAENSLTCSGCGSPLTVRSGPGGDCFLGCTAYPRCQHPIQKITPEILERYLSAAGLNCPAGHLLKAVPAKHGPIALCSHSPACRYVLHLRDLL